MWIKRKVLRRKAKNKMAIIRQKEIKGYSKEDLKKRLNELRLESVKMAKPSHGSSVKTREVKRTIARILTQMNMSKDQKQTQTAAKEDKKHTKPRVK